MASLGQSPEGLRREAGAREHGPPVAERVGFEPTERLNTPHLLSRKAPSTGLGHLSPKRAAMLPRVRGSGRSGGRVDEGSGLENRRLARVRGFESLPLRCTLGGLRPPLAALAPDRRPAPWRSRGRPYRPGGTWARRPWSHSSAARHLASTSRRTTSPCSPAAGKLPRNFTSACFDLSSRRQSATTGSAM